MIKSAYNNEMLFERSCELYLDLSFENKSNSGWGALFSLVASAVNTALTEHIQAARMANGYIVHDIPCGPYDPDYLSDQEVSAEKKDIKVTVKEYY